jgi:uncharacterized membrane protein
MQTEAMDHHSPPLATTRARRAITSRPSARPINVQPTERLVSALAGGLAVAVGLGSHSWPGKALAVLGGGLVVRGASGHCPLYQALDGNTARTSTPGHDVTRSATVQKTPEEVYRAWRQPETFVSVMSHLASLTPLADGHMRWSLTDPLGREHLWEMALVVDEPGRRLRWASLEHAPLAQHLTLELAPAPGQRGTEMKLRLQRDPPPRVLGAALQKLLGVVPGSALQRALGNMKCLLEAGELPSLHHNPAARKSAQA